MKRKGDNHETGESQYVNISDDSCMQQTRPISQMPFTAL